METYNVRVRVRSGESEIEIESPSSALDEVAEKAESLLLRMMELTPANQKSLTTTKTIDLPEAITLEEMPKMVIEKGDSLADILEKLFSTSWGTSPRKLGEILLTLKSYGVIYPKSSVAVSLLRMVHAGKLRRFKDEGGYVYVSTTPVITSHEPLVRSE